MERKWLNMKEILGLNARKKEKKKKKKRKKKRKKKGDEMEVKVEKNR